MSPKYVYQGVGVTAKYLTVYFALRIGTADRVLEVKVPMSELTRPEILDNIDRECARQLREYWQAGEQMISFEAEPDPPW